ncbi:hypothetical protein P153DRAFT_368240 [Dothidotthia symphoricarpi CBS 119687]|uniref:Uncharacterized protein n=1 Tax=Dothidotthia symphoricarpi CBS 119687 TaxID=1392245 RepID=A0A6A6A984_9PLEO|nr:uncharacterized protein P153DRAFT_368240 [Dothidotthia symphoricarpi CBS 119687]KAF2127664.1 hypothetical protein P153DRAFT_368240 [Dothidotthia symphoricarpi CBS 119687]
MLREYCPESTQKICTLILAVVVKLSPEFVASSFLLFRLTERLGTESTAGTNQEIVASAGPAHPARQPPTRISGHFFSTMGCSFPLSLSIIVFASRTSNTLLTCLPVCAPHPHLEVEYIADAAAAGHVR